MKYNEAVEKLIKNFVSRGKVNTTSSMNFADKSIGSMKNEAKNIKFNTMRGNKIRIQSIIDDTKIDNQANQVPVHTVSVVKFFILRTNNSHGISRIQTYS